MNDLIASDNTISMAQVPLSSEVSATHMGTDESGDQHTEAQGHGHNVNLQPRKCAPSNREKTHHHDAHPASADTFTANVFQVSFEPSGLKNDCIKKKVQFIPNGEIPVKIEKGMPSEKEGSTMSDRRRIGVRKKPSNAGFKVLNSDDPESPIMQHNHSANETEVKAEAKTDDSQKNGTAEVADVEGSQEKRRTSSGRKLDSKPSFDKVEEITEDDLYGEEKLTNKDDIRYWIGLLLIFMYLVLVAGVVMLIYKALHDIIMASRYPVRSISYRKVETYAPPAIVIFPVGNHFRSCDYYSHNVVGSKVKLKELNLNTTNCTVEKVTYQDPEISSVRRTALVFRGPTDVLNLEALFLHFVGHDLTRDFFTVSYFLLPSWSNFTNSHNKSLYLQRLHGKVPTFAASAQLRIWIKMSLKEVFLIGDNSPVRDFKTEASVVQYMGHWHSEERPFFIFFEWKNNLIEESTLIYAMTPWNFMVALCGLLLVLYKAGMLAWQFRTSFKKVRKETIRRRTIRQTLREQAQQAIQDGTTGQDKEEKSETLVENPPQQEEDNRQEGSAPIEMKPLQAVT